MIGIFISIKGSVRDVYGLSFRGPREGFDHEILLGKLRKYGIRNTELEWFSTYLRNRWQCCKVNGVLSTVEKLTCGVRQGSCFDPVLFLLLY